MAKIPWWNVELGNEAADAVYNAVRDRRLNMGVLVQELENKIAQKLQVKNVVAVTSGTSALTLALMEAGVSPGTEVIVPNRTWIATAHTAQLLGAKVILVDVDEKRSLIEPAEVEKAITPLTKVILPVHLGGRACNMPALRAIAKKHNICVIEDAAQAFLSASPEGGFLGTHSRSGCFSMTLTKLITCGQGGFVVTNDDDVAKRLRLIRTHGVQDVINAKYTLLGSNFRMTDVLASIALSQLAVVEERIAAYKKLYFAYEKVLASHPDIQLFPVNVEAGEMPLWVEALCCERDRLISDAASLEIEMRPVPPNLNKAAYFSQQEKQFKYSSIFESRQVELPGGPNRRPEEIETVLRFLQNWRR